MSMHPPQSRLNLMRRRSGSTLIEFALVAPILITLSMGVLQFGIIMNATNTLTNITRDAARFAAINPISNGIENDGSENDTIPAPGTIRRKIKELCDPTTINYKDIQKGGRITITPLGVGLRKGGEPISVSIRYPMSKKHFVPNKVLGVKILPPEYTSTGTFLIERD